MAEFLNASVAPENFDWDAFEGNSAFSGEEKQKIQDAYDQTLSKVVENEVVEGEVTAINKREVIVTIGGKSEGVISAPEFRYNPDLKVGDKVEVFVESAEDRKGQLVISHKKARALKSWDRVNEAFENDEVVKLIEFNGEEYLFYPSFQCDVALLRGTIADENGNLVYKGTSQNFCPLMATAADVVIVEPQEIVKAGEIAPENVKTPGIFVDYIIK